ncbi:MAG: nucleotidyltransferase [Ruminiclostridium sp.]|nr:nucleotidyltransferase [Ruminiclostridium sp.]
MDFLHENISQKLEVYKDAAKRLENIINQPEVNDYRLDALIKRFEFTYELSWKLLKLLLEYKGVEARSPRDCFKEAFAIGLINNGPSWIDMLNDRNLTTHTYKEADAREIAKRVENIYFLLLYSLIDTAERTLKIWP